VGRIGHFMTAERESIRFDQMEFELGKKIFGMNEISPMGKPDNGLKFDQIMPHKKMHEV